MFDTYAHAVEYQARLAPGDKGLDILVEEDGSILVSAPELLTSIS